MAEFYIYCADVYCKECVTGLRKDADYAHAMGDIPDYLMGDSNHYPQGPYDNEESDTPTHCGNCGMFLEQPLTQDGYQYVIEQLSATGQYNEVEQQWYDYYGNDGVRTGPGTIVRLKFLLTDNLTTN